MQEDAFLINTPSWHAFQEQQVTKQHAFQKEHALLVQAALRAPAQPFQRWSSWWSRYRAPSGSMHGCPRGQCRPWCAGWLPPFCAPLASLHRPFPTSVRLSRPLMMSSDDSTLACRLLGLPALCIGTYQPFVVAVTAIRLVAVCTQVAWLPCLV